MSQLRSIIRRIGIEQRAKNEPRGTRSKRDSGESYPVQTLGRARATNPQNENLHLIDKPSTMTEIDSKTLLKAAKKLLKNQSYKSLSDLANAVHSKLLKSDAEPESSSALLDCLHMSSRIEYCATRDRLVWTKTKKRAGTESDSSVRKKQKTLEDNDAQWNDFDVCTFPSPLLEHCRSQFRAPTPIQAKAWPLLVKNRDMVAIAETGSGKTLAFGLPALQKVG